MGKGRLIKIDQTMIVAKLALRWNSSRPASPLPMAYVRSAEEECLLSELGHEVIVAHARNVRLAIEAVSEQATIRWHHRLKR